MAKRDYSSLRKELLIFENTYMCSLCVQKFSNPVRIKVCGHYFCENCLQQRNAKKGQCPKCKLPYANDEIDFQNTARKVTEYLEKLKEYLNDADYVNTIENEDNKEHIEQDKSTNSKLIVIEQTEETKNQNKFIYLNKVYHLNFVDQLDKVNAKGESPLHIACKKKNVTGVLELLKKKIDINKQDFAGWAPIHEAVESQSIIITEMLLKNGALVDINGQEYTTPLHKAAVLNNKSLIKLLLKYGASKDVLDYFGKKPIDHIKDPEINQLFDSKIMIKNRIEEIFCCKKMVAYCYYIDNTFTNKLKQCKNVKINNSFDPKKVTHFIIKKTHRPSWKIFLAMVNGCSIITQEKIDDYLKDNYFVDIPNVTFIQNFELNIGIQRAMMNSLLKLPQLFDGIRFYIHAHKHKVSLDRIKISKEELISLIIEGGGTILRRAPTPNTCEEFKNFPYHSNKDGNTSRCCNYIIYEEQNPPKPLYKMIDLKHKSSEWLISCIMHFTINN